MSYARGGPTSYPFIYHFWQSRDPFCIPSIDKWYPLHTSLELFIPSRAMAPDYF